eukprot:353226-Chlamydomonas_euryale.AAC.12
MLELRRCSSSAMTAAASRVATRTPTRRTTTARGVSWMTHRSSGVEGGGHAFLARPLGRGGKRGAEQERLSATLDGWGRHATTVCGMLMANCPMRALHDGRPGWMSCSVALWMVACADAHPHRPNTAP